MAEPEVRDAGTPTYGDSAKEPTVAYPPRCAVGGDSVSENRILVDK
jgi:hypothetical protein